MENISFHFKIPHFQIPEKTLIHWIKTVVSNKFFDIGQINIIFVDKPEILQLNIKYLQHNYYTDIITFDYSIDTFITGDLFICIPIVKQNACLYKKSFLEELKRVIIHGILHLLNYKDKTPYQKKVIREEENRCLRLLKTL